MNRPEVDMPSKLHPAVLAAIDECGGRLISAKQNKHFKLRIDFDGIERNIVCPVSPSDHRWLANFRRYLFRAARESRFSHTETPADLAHGKATS